MGKGRFSFRRTRGRSRTKKNQDATPVLTIEAGHSSLPVNNALSSAAAAAGGNGGTVGKGKKKQGGPRLWMRFDRFGQTEVLECDKSVIIKLAAIPARDLRILGPVFSQSSSILAREKAMVVNLEFIKAIVTAEEVLLLDPLRSEVLPFVDQLRQQLLHKTNPIDNDDQIELPFEFRVLEIALESVCTYLDSTTADLEREAYPVLDELARKVSTTNLEHVRSLKSNLTRILARVQKVRDEIEHLLDDNEDMSHLYLTRKKQPEALLDASMDSLNSIVPIVPIVSHFPRVSSKRSGSVTTNMDDNGVEDLEMLLEAYFVQLDGIRNKILSVREYIDDTEDYVNIQLDNQRNELIQLQLILTSATFAIAVEILVLGIVSMNIPCPLYNINGIFGIFMGVLTATCIIIFLVILAYARWKKLLGS